MRGRSELSRCLIPHESNWRRKNELDQADWQPANGVPGAWGLETKETPGGQQQYWLTKGGRRAARIPLDDVRQGRITVQCWLPGSDGQPAAVALGTNRQCNLYVYRLAEQGTCPLIRQFRGHTGPVASLSYSQDLKYLLSAAADGTIRVWRWDGAAVRDAGYTNLDRWGARFVIEGETLTVTELREDGPLYFRGIRQGDTVTRLELPQEGDGQAQIKAINQPVAMLKALSENPADQLVLFHYQRGRTSQKRFQSYPAWQPVVSLLVADDGEWAYWTPAGYYDASFEGQRLFGWQVNRGPSVAPDFFLAAQVRAALERPRVMAKLLDAGSLEEAFRQARRQVPASSQFAVRDQSRLLPRIEVLTPRPGDILSEPTATIRASIIVRRGQTLIPPKAFANGVVATGRRRLSRESLGDGVQFVYEWQAALPADRQIAIQVIAATEDEVSAAESLIVSRAETPLPAAKPRLYVVAAGVDQYQDARYPPLADRGGECRQPDAGPRSRYVALLRQPIHVIAECQCDTAGLASHVGAVRGPTRWLGETR